MSTHEAGVSIGGAGEAMRRLQQLTEPSQPIREELKKAATRAGFSPSDLQERAAETPIGQTEAGARLLQSESDAQRALDSIGELMIGLAATQDERGSR